MTSHGAAKNKQKSKAGRGVASGSYYGGDQGFGGIGQSFGMDKMGKSGGAFDLSSFDSDPFGKLGGGAAVAGSLAASKKNKGAMDSSFGPSFGLTNRRGGANALDLMET